MSATVVSHLPPTTFADLAGVWMLTNMSKLLAKEYAKSVGWISNAGFKDTILGESPNPCYWAKRFSHVFSNHVSYDLLVFLTNRVTLLGMSTKVWKNPEKVVFKAKCSKGFGGFHVVVASAWTWWLHPLFHVYGKILRFLILPITLLWTRFCGVPTHKATHKWWNSYLTYVNNVMKNRSYHDLNNCNKLLYNENERISLDAFHNHGCVIQRSSVIAYGEHFTVLQIMTNSYLE